MSNNNCSDTTMAVTAIGRDVVPSLQHRLGCQAALSQLPHTLSRAGHLEGSASGAAPLVNHVDHATTGAHIEPLCGGSPALDALDLVLHTHTDTPHPPSPMPSRVLACLPSLHLVSTTSQPYSSPTYVHQHTRCDRKPQEHTETTRLP